MLGGLACELEAGYSCGLAAISLGRKSAFSGCCVQRLHCPPASCYEEDDDDDYNGSNPVRHVSCQPQRIRMDRELLRALLIGIAKTRSI